MVDIATGEVKGRHDGLMYYTFGQRQGLGIGGSGNGEPWFVADKDLENESFFYVVQGDAHASLYSTGLTATGVNWIAGAEHMPNVPYLYCQIPLSSAGSRCNLDLARNGSVDVHLTSSKKPLHQDKPLSSTTEMPCLGGGTIDQVQKVPVPAMQ